MDISNENGLVKPLSPEQLNAAIIINSPPTSISLDNLSVIENKDGHIANITGEDPDDDSLTYSVLSGQDSDLVEMWIDYQI